LNTQYSRDALVSAEQFGLVGSGAVRGFGERTLAADIGYVASAEIYTPILGVAMLPGRLRLLAFYDTGAGSFNKRQAGDALKRTAVASLGLGLRYELNQHFNLRFDLANVLDADRRDNDTQTGDWRGHIALSLGF
jgi:hemolysin activation/secretion protein